MPQPHPVSDDVQAELKALMEEDDDGSTLSLDTVIDSAKDPASPLHQYFEWNRGKAARLYNLHQARVLVARCYQDVHTKGGNVVRIRTFIVDRNTGREHTEPNVYRPVVQVVKKASGRNRMLEQARDDMESYIERYEHLKEIIESGVISRGKKVIANINKSLTKKKPTKKRLSPGKRTMRKRTTSRS